MWIDSDDYKMVKLYVGGSVKDFIVFGSIRSRQLDRIQLDAAADGSMHVVACKGSVGEMSIDCLEDPNTCNTHNFGNVDSALQYYAKEWSSFRRRKARLELFSRQNKLIATFEGVLYGVDVRAGTERNLPQIITTLHLKGSWHD